MKNRSKHKTLAMSGLVLALTLIQAQDLKGFPLKVCIDNRQREPFHIQLIYKQSKGWQGGCEITKPNFSFKTVPGVQCFPKDLDVDENCVVDGNLKMDFWLFVDVPIGKDKYNTHDAGRHSYEVSASGEQTYSFKLYRCGNGFCSVKY